jgi:hypothetical protein
MSKKASNLCFRHLNLKYKTPAPNSTPDTRTEELVRKHVAPATGSQPAGPDRLFPYKESEILGDPEIRDLTRRSNQMALTMLNGFQSERCRFGVF